MLDNNPRIHHPLVVPFQVAVRISSAIQETMMKGADPEEAESKVLAEHYVRCIKQPGERRLHPDSTQ